MSDTGIAIELTVPGVDKAIADLRAVADALKNAGAASSTARMAAVGGAGGGATAAMSPSIVNMKVAALTLNATTVVLHGNAQQNNSWNQTTNTVNKFGSGLNTAKFLVLAVGAALVEMTKAVADANVALMQIGITSGGTSSQSAQLASIGRAAGIGDIGGLSRQFMAKISSDSMAAAFANRQGIHAYGPMDPNLNAAQKLLKATEYILTASKHDATQFARIEGLEELLKLRGLSEKSQANLMVGDPAVQNSVMNERTQKDMLEFQYALARVGTALLNVATPLLDMVLTTYHVVEILNKLADWLNQTAVQLSVMSEIIQATSVILNPMSKAADRVKAVSDFVAALVEIKSGEQERAQLMKDHAKAMRDHTDALEYATRNGTYGGGERARGAVPTKWTGVNAAEYLQHAKRLGAFNL